MKIEILVKDERGLFSSDYVPLTVRGNPGFIFQGTNPLEYSFGRAHKTFDIDILRDPDNNALLNNIFSSNIFPQIIFNAIALLDGTYLSGKLLIYSVSTHGASAQFISDMGGLWEELGDKNIREDFDWTEYDHIYDHPSIYAFQQDTSGAIRYDNAYRGYYPGARPSWITPDPSLPGFTPVLGAVMGNLKLSAIIEKIFEGYTLDIEGIPEELWRDRLFLQTSPPQKTIRDDLNFKINRTAADDNLDFVSVGAGSREDLSGPQYTRRTWDLKAEQFLGTPLPFDPLIIKGDMLAPVGEGGNRAFYFSLRGALSAIRIRNDSGFGSAQLENRELIYSIQEISGTGTVLRTNRLKTFSLPDVEVGSHTDQLSTLFGSEAFETYESGMILLHPLTRFIKWSVIYTHEQIDSVDAISPMLMNLAIRRLNADLVGSEVQLISLPGKGKGEIVEGKELAPDRSVRSLISDFLSYFNLEMYLNEINKNITFRNRFRTNPTIFNLSPYIIEDTLRVEIEPQPPNYRIQLGGDRTDLLSNWQIERGYINWSRHPRYSEIGSQSFTGVSPFTGILRFIPAWTYRLDINNNEDRTIEIKTSWTLNADNRVGAPILIKKNRDNEDLSYNPLTPYDGRLLNVMQTAEWSSDFSDRLVVWSGEIDAIRYLKDPSFTNPDLNYVDRNWPVDVWSNFYIDGQYSTPGVEPEIGPNALYLGVKTLWFNRFLVRLPVAAPYGLDTVLNPFENNTPIWSDMYRGFHFVNIDRITKGRQLYADLHLNGEFINNLNTGGEHDLSSVYYIGEEDWAGYYQIVSLEYKNGNIWTGLFMEVPKPELIDTGIGSFSNDFSNDFDI